MHSISGRRLSPLIATFLTVARTAPYAERYFTGVAFTPTHRAVSHAVACWNSALDSLCGSEGHCSTLLGDGVPSSAVEGDSDRCRWRWDERC